jgi:hypothetical protein
MTGFIATGLCVAVIAGLMIVGIKVKMPPPDPNWRQHLPPPPPQPTGIWLHLLRGSRAATFAMYFIMVLAAAVHLDSALKAVALVLVAVLFMRAGLAVAWGIHIRNERSRAGWQPFHRARHRSHAVRPIGLIERRPLRRASRS